MKNIPFLICLLLFSCVSNNTIKKEIVDNTENINIEQNLNFKYDFKVYNHKDSIDIDELITSDEGDDAILDNPETFIYMDSERQIRMSIFLNNQWRTWTIYNAENEEYYATMYSKNFDNIGNNEIMIQSKYGLAPQSTFGSSYYGSFEIWNIDSIQLYFDIGNYSYSDDMGRNGEQSYTKEYLLKVEVKEKQIFVGSGGLDLSESELNDESSGEYLLENGKVIKKKN